jgi:iron-sulfur cluster assembly protein
MFEITEKASDKLKELLKDKEEVPGIRIVLSQGGWSGPSLGMALDEPGDKDEVFDDRELTYIIERELYEKVKPIKVDYVDSFMGTGFDISSSLNMGSACGSSCSC